MALITVQEPTQAGIAPTYAAATVSGDTVVVNSRTWLHVKNTGSQITVTIPKAVAVMNQPGYGDIPVADIAVVIPATTGDKLIAIDPGGHAPGGIASITYSAVTGVTIGVFRLPQV